MTGREADELGLSRSAFIINRVEEASAATATTDESSHSDELDVAALQAEIDRLQSELAEPTEAHRMIDQLF